MPELGIGCAQGAHLASLANCRFPTDVEASLRWFRDDIVEAAHRSDRRSHPASRIARTGLGAGDGETGKILRCPQGIRGHRENPMSSTFDRRAFVKTLGALPLLGYIQAQDLMAKTMKGRRTQVKREYLHADRRTAVHQRARHLDLSERLARAARSEARQTAGGRAFRGHLRAGARGEQAAGGIVPAPKPAWSPPARRAPWRHQRRHASPVPIPRTSGSCPIPPASRAKSSCWAGAARSTTPSGWPAANWSSSAEWSSSRRR